MTYRTLMLLMAYANFILGVNWYLSRLRQACLTFLVYSPLFLTTHGIMNEITTTK